MSDTFVETESMVKGQNDRNGTFCVTGVGQAFTVTCPVDDSHEIPCHTEGFYPEYCEDCENETRRASTWSKQQQRRVEDQFDAFCFGTEAA